MLVRWSGPMAGYAAYVELRQKSLLRFFNQTERRVELVWINHEGHHVKSKTLSPGDFLDADTYIMHPWLFIDADTQDRLVVMSQEVYLPEPWYLKYQAMTPEERRNKRVERTHVYITIPVFTLKQRSLQVVRNNLKHPQDAYKLELPRCLQQELYAMLKERYIAKYGPPPA